MSTTIAHTVDQTWINQAVDLFYSKMLDDYRINRFFNNKPIAEQTPALKQVIPLLLSKKASDEQLYEAYDQFFTQSFARNNHKPSLVTGNDFGFLLDIIGGAVPPRLVPVCEAHNYLLKMTPDDEHFDVVMEHLQATLHEMATPAGQEGIKQHLLDLAEQAREAVLGRLPEPA